MTAHMVPIFIHTRLLLMQPREKVTVLATHAPRLLALAEQARAFADAWAAFEATNSTERDWHVSPVLVGASGVFLRLGVNQLCECTQAIVDRVQRAIALVEVKDEEQAKEEEEEGKAPKTKRRRTTTSP